MTATIDNTLIFRMYGVPCGTCARPAVWYTDGVLLPCGCGARNRDERRQAKDRVAVYERAQR